jgi:hypothetical protein
MKSKPEYLKDYQLFCESALLDALSKFNNRFRMDSIAAMESTMREFKANLYELKSILVERNTSIVSELQEKGGIYSDLKHELTIIASQTLQSFISRTAPHTLTFKR